MRFDVNFLGAVAMPDAGRDGPPAPDRRYGREAFAAAYADLVALAQTADRCGYDTMWYTEHHFQHEGYEVVPNQILLGAYSAALTDRINFGQMFNIVPQWNPLRLAEDFAAADILTGGRMRFGVGRGTVPRELQSLGATIESLDNALDGEAERLNREVFEEAMEVIRLAFTQERFSYSGKHFVYPPPGIPDRNQTVTDLTLVPNVLRPVEIYQACTSPRTQEYVVAHGHVGVFHRQSPDRLRRAWERHDKLAAAAGRPLAPGAERMIVVSAYVADSYERALAAVRPGHDEIVKLLAPYGRFALYDPPPGVEALPTDYAPTLEESVRQRQYLIGDAATVAAELAGLAELLDLQMVSVAFDAPGLSTGEVGEQMERFAAEVIPLVNV